MPVLAADWGPVGVWAGAIMTAVVALVSVLVALGFFDRFNGPRLTITFENREPWVRQGGPDLGPRGPRDGASRDRTGNLVLANTAHRTIAHCRIR
jgi:hypothetical protein